MHPQELPTASLPLLQVPQYDVTIRRFNDWLAGRPVTEQAVRDFFTDRMAAGYSARSIKLQKVAIKAGIRKAFPAHDTRITAALDTLFRSIRTPQPERGVQEHHATNFPAAIDYFQQVINANPQDQVAAIYLRRSEYFAEHGVPIDWEGISIMEGK